MPNQVPESLKGLRVRFVSSPDDSPEQRARIHLKKLLDAHGQHIGKKTRGRFRETLNGLLLHGLRARVVKSAEESDSDDYSTGIKFKASDGQLYIARDARAWAQVQRRDKGARKVASSESEQKERSGATAITQADQAWQTTR